MSEEIKSTSSEASSSAARTGINIEVKSTVRSGQSGQPEKRSHSEVADSSFGDEVTMLNKQLEKMNTDLQETRESVKGLLSKEEMKAFIVSTVEAVTAQIEKKMRKRLDKIIDEKVEQTVEEKVKEKNAELNDRLDSLVLENIKLKEDVENLKASFKECEKYTKTALRKSNTNEQYSRKNNVKIMGIVETEDETEESLTQKVIDILDKKAKVKVEERKIMALHRIPGKSGMPKPVLVKLTNNSEKTKIMKKRQEMKRAGYKLVDDVTKMNTQLINSLLLHEKIDSAWYFNGSVFGKTTAGKRHKFDICTEVDEVIEPKPEEMSAD